MTVNLSMERKMISGFLYYSSSCCFIFVQINVEWRLFIESVFSEFLSRVMNCKNITEKAYTYEVTDANDVSKGTAHGFPFL